MNTKFLVKNGIFLSVFLGAALLPYQEVVAQGDRPMSTPDRRVSRELWDIWRQGFEYYDKGEMKMIAGKYAESLPLYKKSLEAFQEVRRQNPQWNRNVIEYRMNLCRRRLMTAGRRAEEAADAAKRRMNRAEAPAAGTPAAASRARTAGAGSAGTSRELDRKLQQAMRENALRKKQIEELQKEMMKLRPDAARADVALRQIDSLMKERANLEKQLASIKLQFEKIQEEQRKSSPRTAELERLLAAEQNKSAAYAKAFRERSAAFAKLEEEMKNVSSQLVQVNKEYAELTRKYTAEMQSTERLVRENSVRHNELADALKRSQEESRRLNETLAKKNSELERSAAELQTLRAGRISSGELTRKIEAEAAALRKENNAVKGELEKLRAERIKLDARIAGLNGELEQTRKNLVLNMEQRNDFARANDTISKQFAELELSFRKMRDANAQLQKQLDAAIRERELLASKVNDQLSETLKNQLAAARQEVRNRTAERDAAIKEIAQLKRFGDPAALNTNLTEARNRQAALERSSGELEVKLAEERRKLAVATSALAVSQGEVAALGIKLKQLQLESGRTNEQIAQKNQTLDRLNAELRSKNERLAALEAERMQLNQKQAELAAQLQSNAAAGSSLRQQKEALAARLQQAEADNAVLKSQHAALAAQLKNFDADKTGLKSQNDAVAARLRKSEAENAALKSQHDSVAVQLRKSEAENAALKSQYDAVSVQLRKSEAENAALKTRHDAVSVQLKRSEAENAALREQQTRLSAQISKQQRESANALLASETARQQLQAQLKAQEGKPSEIVVELRKQLTEASEKNRQLLTENSALKSESQNLRTQAASVQTLQQENARLKSEGDVLRSQAAGVQTLQQENARLKSEGDVLRTQAASIQSLQQENARLKSEGDSLRSQAANAQSLQQENARLKSEGDTLRTQAANAQSLQQENATLRKQLSDADNRNQGLRKKMESMKQEQTDLRRQLAESKEREKTVPAPVPVPVPVADDSKEKLAALEKQNAELKAGSAQTARELAEARRQIAALNGKLADANAKLTAATQDNGSRLTEINQLKSSLALQEQKIADLQGKLLRSRQTAAGREKKRLELLNEIAQLQKTLLSTAEERSQLVRELDAVKAKLPTAAELAAARAGREETLQENTKLQAEKTALENNITRLQAQIGRTQTRMEKMRKAISGYEKDVARLRNTVLDLEKVKNDLDVLRKEAAGLRQENQTVRKNADSMEQNLKSELQKQAAQLLVVREENTQYKDSVRKLTTQRNTLEKDVKQAKLQIADLKKQLVKALSEEEKIKLKKQIAELNATLRKLAEGSEDELVREAASKNVVITDLLKEQEAMKKQIRELNKSAESYRILAVRQREAADKAQNEARIALYDAKKTRGELKMLRADIEDGVVKIPESRRTAMKERRRAGANLPEGELPASREKSEPKPQVKVVKPPAAAAAAVPAQKEQSGAASKAVAKKEVAKVEKSKEYLEAMKNGAEAEKSGDLGMALWHFWQAADLQDKDPEPYMALTRIHLKRKETDSAIKAYRKAVLNGGKRDLALEKELNLEK